MQIQSGFLKDGKVHLVEFYTDHNADYMTWFKEIGDVIDLGDRCEIGNEQAKHRGRCYDTGEYISQVGETIKAFVDKAPKGTTLVVFSYNTACGTRTYYEEVNAKYYH